MLIHKSKHSTANALTEEDSLGRLYYIDYGKETQSVIFDKNDNTAENLLAILKHHLALQNKQKAALYVSKALESLQNA